MKIVSFNVNGLRAIVKKLPSTLGSFFRDLGVDVVCLQETKIADKQLTDDLTQVPGYEAFFASCTMKQGYSGVCTYAREGITIDAKAGLGRVKEMDEEGRVMVTDHGGFVLLNIYFPNGGRGGDRLTFKNNFQDEVQKYCAELRQQGRHVIVVGDVNIAHTELDIYNPEDPDNSEHSGFKPEERKWMSDFLESGFVDSFRERHKGETGHYTWWSPRAGARRENRGWRLDYAFVDKEFYGSDVVDVGIMRLVGGSDHCPIFVTLKQQPPLPPHSPPLLSSKRRSKQAKLKSFFGGSSKAPQAKRPRHDTEDAAGDSSQPRGEEDEVIVVDRDDEASIAGSIREEPERVTAESTAKMVTKAVPKQEAVEQMKTESPAAERFKSATEEAVEGATTIVIDAINAGVPASSSASSASTSPRESALQRIQSATGTEQQAKGGLIAESKLTQKLKEKATEKAKKTKTKKKTEKAEETKAQKARGGRKASSSTPPSLGEVKGSTQQTSLLSFLGKRKGREADETNRAQASSPSSSSSSSSAVLDNEGTSPNQNS